MSGTAYAEREDDRIVLSVAYVDKDLVKQVPGASWKRASVSEEGRWSTRLSWAACLALRGIFGDRLVVGPGLAEWATEEVRERINPAMYLRYAREIKPEDFVPGTRAYDLLAALNKIEDELAGRGLFLYPFQRTGALFLALGRFQALLDDMGTGKTVMAVVAARLLHEMGDGVLPAVVFCPSAVKIAWARTFELWWPGPKTVVLKGTAPKRKKLLEDSANDIFVLNWEQSLKHSRLAPYGSTAMTEADREPKELQALRPRLVIADEAHALRNPSKQTRAVWATAHQDSVASRFALSGTPVADTPADAWGLLHFLYPAEHPSKTKFVDRYVEVSFDWAGYTVMGGLRPENRDEFFRVTDPRTRRVTKAEAMPHLPPLVYETRELEMGDRQRRAYEQLRDDKLAELESGLLVPMNRLTALTRLAQFASSYAEIEVDATRCRHGLPPGTLCAQCPDQFAVPAELVHLAEPSNKVDALEDLLEELGPTEPLVAAMASRQLLELCEHRLDKRSVPYVSVKGGQTADLRQAMIDRFQAGHARVLLFTLAAGGTGLTLTRARVLAFLQKSWDAIQVSQAEARVYREGAQQHESVLVLDYVSEGTVEVEQRSALAGKGERLEEVVRDEDALRLFLCNGEEPPKPKRKTVKKPKKETDQ